MNAALFVKPPTCDCKATYLTGMRMKNKLFGPVFFIELTCSGCGSTVSHNVNCAEWVITPHVEKVLDRVLAPKTLDPHP